MNDVPITFKICYCLRELLGILLLMLTLFLSAGRWDWIIGWVLVGLNTIWVLVTTLILLIHNPALIAERLGPKKGAKKWDITIMSTIGICTLVRLAVAGFDKRLHWSGNTELAFQSVAAVVVALGFGLMVWAIVVNSYFSQIVHIQRERSQRVIQNGPYRLVRHPAYLGSVLQELTIPLMLGSWWAYLPAAIALILFLIRTKLEDKTLIQELPGYSDYAEMVRYRLIPGIW